VTQLTISLEKIQIHNKYTKRNNYRCIILIFFVGAGFIPTRNTGCLEERVGIKPTPTNGNGAERYMHQLMRYVYSCKAKKALKFPWLGPDKKSEISDNRNQFFRRKEVTRQGLLADSESGVVRFNTQFLANLNQVVARMPKQSKPNAYIP
jgi:hypothetical protein